MEYTELIYPLFSTKNKLFFSSFITFLIFLFAMAYFLSRKFKKSNKLKLLIYGPSLSGKTLLFHKLCELPYSSVSSLKPNRFSTNIKRKGNNAISLEIIDFPGHLSMINEFQGEISIGKSKGKQFCFIFVVRNPLLEKQFTLSAMIKQWEMVCQNADDIFVLFNSSNNTKNDQNNEILVEMKKIFIEQCKKDFRDGKDLAIANKIHFYNGDLIGDGEILGKIKEWINGLLYSIFLILFTEGNLQKTRR